MNQQRPKIAIIDANTLSCIGLKQLLQNFMPIAEIEGFGSMTEFQANHPEHYMHYFVAMNIFLENRQFFAEHPRQTIGLTMSLNDSSHLGAFHSLCVNVPEHELVRSLLILNQEGHHHGRNLPPMPKALTQRVLSNREIEVMALIVQGHINKEIADKLNIALATVVTHRKNIMEKLGLRSVSALTIDAVTHGYVDINKV